MSKSQGAKSLTIREAALRLQISPATVKNWVRRGEITPLEGEKELRFDSAEVEDLRNRLDRGEVDRLRGGANKLLSRRRVLPSEYVEDGEALGQLKKLVTQIRKAKIPLDQALWGVALNWLYREGVLFWQNGRSSFSIDPRLPVASQIKEELHRWPHSDGEVPSFLLEASLPPHVDPLGLFYQALIKEGGRYKKGLFYTPTKIVEDLAQAHPLGAGDFFDPCCGSGQYLLALGKGGLHPSQLFGLDKDPRAVRIARLNLLLHFRHHQFTPSVFEGNALSGELPGPLASRVGTFDFVATNPPWGLRFSRLQRKRFKKRFPAITSSESFSLFLALALKMLRPLGRLSFLFPRSMLNVRRHRDIRQLLLEKTNLEKITDLGQVFDSVLSPVFRLEAQKREEVSSSRSQPFPFFQGEESHLVYPRRFEKNLHSNFDLYTSPQDARIIAKIYNSPYLTLEDRARWALGIVTGDNGRFVKGKKRSPEWEPVIRGKNIRPFEVEKPSQYLHFQPEKFQQMASEELYRAEKKLIYRFVSRRLVFAIDDQQRLTLNSANCLLPEVENYPLEAICALFNSSLYQFLFQKKFFAQKVLRSHLEALPLPQWPAEVLDRLARLASEGKREEIDRFVCRQFGFSDGEQKRVGEEVI